MAETLQRFRDPFASAMQIQRKCIHFGYKQWEIEEKFWSRERDRERMCGGREWEESDGDDDDDDERWWKRNRYMREREREEYGDAVWGYTCNHKDEKW